MTIVWTERYNCHRASIGNGFELCVNWDSGTRPKGTPENAQGGFIVYACGLRCKKCAYTAEEGKAIAILFARKILAETLANLTENKA